MSSWYDFKKEMNSLSMLACTICNSFRTFTKQLFIGMQDLTCLSWSFTSAMKDIL